MRLQTEASRDGATQIPAEENVRRNCEICDAMRKHAVVLGLLFAGFAAFALFAGWAFYKGSQFGGGWQSLGPIWPFVLGGCVAVAALTGALMWLAFYSADHGYDDPIDPDGRVG